MLNRPVLNGRVERMASLPDVLTKSKIREPLQLTLLQVMDTSTESISSIDICACLAG